ncbi:MAG: bifunctional folylpolyglutamate synthase/dihydrofolate synthase [Lachnospiraceae bacterium]
MNYSQAKEFILGASSFGSVMGLDRVRELLRRLSNPQDDLKFIHIAGTNGKGSVLAYLAAVLEQAGYTIGCYSSPPIHSYREVIRINGENIDRDAVARHLTTIRTVARSMLEDGFMHPTRFEMEVALAFLFYKEHKCDLVLLETGMGGLEDATNIVQTSILEIITSVSMDHMTVLGNTLEDIARQKAGIIKEHTDVLSIRQDPVTEKVLEQISGDRHCTLIFARPDKIRIQEYGLERQVFHYTDAGGEEYLDITIPLAGIHQFRNAAIAIEAVKILSQHGFMVTRQQLADGLLATRWDGRMSIVHHNPLVLIDGAHNEDAARQLADSIELYFGGRRIIYLLGIFRDKEYEKIIRLTARYADEIITVNVPRLERLLPAAELAEIVRLYHDRVISSASIGEAVNLAFERAGTEEIIIAFGSLSFLGEVEKVCKDRAR